MRGSSGVTLSDRQRLLGALHQRQLLRRLRSRRKEIKPNKTWDLKFDACVGAFGAVRCQTGLGSAADPKTAGQVLSRSILPNLHLHTLLQRLWFVPVHRSHTLQTVEGGMLSLICQISYCSRRQASPAG